MSDGDHDLPGHTLVFDERFDGTGLDGTRWLNCYLPHWSERSRTEPSLTIANGVLTLFIGESQPPWCPEFDGGVRVSSIQTGHWSGPLGSARGQHRFRDGLVVRDELPSVRLFTPRHGRLEMRARASLNANNLVSLYLIGFEDEPERAGEITLMEVFGHAVHVDGVVVGRGIKKIRDPTLVDDFHETKLPIRLSDWHVYALDWTVDGVSFFVDGELVSRCAQSPDYPMQLMLNLYELPETGGPAPDDGIDARFEIDYVRAYTAG